MADHIHPPKIEYFNVAERTNTDPKGFIRQVERYHLEPWGLYMARTSDHPSFHYLESWIIPRLGMRASIFHFRPIHDRDQDYYIDIGDFTATPTVWKSVDHYLDLVVRGGREVELIDVDELLAAHVAGLIDSDTAQRAIARAAATVDGLASHDYHLEPWLASKGMEISWREPRPVEPI